VDWSGALDYWTGLLDWTTGLDYWTGLLHWITGLDYWTGLDYTCTHVNLPNCLKHLHKSWLVTWDGLTYCCKVNSWVF